MSALKAGIDLLRGALGLAKDVKEALPAGGSGKAIEHSLEQAERQIQLAEAQIAQALGYPLCHCTFPPQIMLFTLRQRYMDIYECPKCGRSDPPDEGPLEQRLG